MRTLKITLVLLCILVSGGVSSATVLLDRVVAIVNKEIITWSELYRTMEKEASPQLKELSEGEKRKIFEKSEAEFLEVLINVRLQLQEAKNLGIGVTAEELDEAIENIKKKYSMDDAGFKGSLEKEGYTIEGYRKRLGEQIIIGKITNHLINSKILVTDEDVKKFMEQNRDISYAADSYRISQILFKRPKNEVDKGGIEEKASVALQRINTGENFGDIAKQYSEDVSAGSGGDMGFIKKGDMSKEFNDVLANMKPGDVSRPFWTEKGLHIIKLEEKIGPGDQDEMMKEAKKILTSKKFAEKYNAWLKGLREKSFIEIKL
ncbi:MAG: peptidylprolyl isomerase [Nitrospirota bacterium]